MHTFTMFNLKMMLSKSLESAWSRGSAWLIFLLPFSWLYLIIITIRRKLYDSGVFKRKSFQTPVIVVGNILVGGSGKTPFVIALVEYLQNKGLKVGVVSRGYKAQCREFPHEVSTSDAPLFCGDEPALIKEKTQACVAIDPNRPRAVQYLIDTHHPDVIISDDGLQHYALKSGYSIVIHPRDALFYPYCLPAGPLREPLSRLSSFDFIVDEVITTMDNPDLDPSWKYNLVTAIGRPERVVADLAKHGLDVEPDFFPDHHAFTADDFAHISGPILMTEKDWIKCKELIIGQPVHVLRLKTILSEPIKQAINRYLGMTS